MFLGHFGLAFAARKASPAISLGALFLACQFADLLWPTLVLAGIERVEIEPGATAFTPLDFVSYPYSHSLVALCLWGVRRRRHLRVDQARAPRGRADARAARLQPLGARFRRRIVPTCRSR